MMGGRESAAHFLFLGPAQGAAISRRGQFTTRRRLSESARFKHRLFSATSQRAK